MKIKKIAPVGIQQELFDKFNKKEKAFVQMLYSRKYTRNEIMDSLFLETRQGYYKLNKVIREKISKWQHSWQ